jgi:hypothetical protein
MIRKERLCVFRYGLHLSSLVKFFLHRISRRSVFGCPAGLMLLTIGINNRIGLLVYVMFV